jgi:hypothetical protein
LAIKLSDVGSLRQDKWDPKSWRFEYEEEFDASFNGKDYDNI